MRFWMVVTAVFGVVMGGAFLHDDVTREACREALAAGDPTRAAANLVFGKVGCPAGQIALRRAFITNTPEGRQAWANVEAARAKETQAQRARAAMTEAATASR